mgnify:FL=1
MLKDIAGAEPKKINAISFNQNTANFEFNNVRLEFGDATTVNINFGKSDAGEFKIRIWALGQEYILNMLTHHYKFNRVSPNLTRFKGIHEFDKFVETITKKTLPSSTLSEYLSVIQTIDDIRNKLARFSVS